MRKLKNEKGFDGILLKILFIVLGIILFYNVYNPNGDHTNSDTPGVVPQIERIADDAIDSIELPD